MSQPSDLPISQGLQLAQKKCRFNFIKQKIKVLLENDSTLVDFNLGGHLYLKLDIILVKQPT